MTKVEAFSFLFSDRLLGFLLITPHKDYIFEVMQSFGNYNYLLMIIISTLGAVSGITLNWWFGHALRSCPIGDDIIEHSHNYSLINDYLKKYWYLPMILCIFPILAAIITTVYGIYRIKYYKILLMFIPLQIILSAYKLF